jgi:hypothetical protein
VTPGLRLFFGFHSRIEVLSAAPQAKPMQTKISHLCIAILTLLPVACDPSDFDAEQGQETEGDPLPRGSVHISGFAALGEVPPLSQATLAYVIDVSGSTGSLDGCGGDLNADGLYSSVLDCEIMALLSVNYMAIATGTIANVGVAVFGSTGATADVRPGGTDQDLLTSADANLDGDLVFDVEKVIRSIRVGSIGQCTAHEVGMSTSYGAGLAAIEPVLAASEQPNKVVVFVSDGLNNVGPGIDEILPMPAGTVIHTFAVGLWAACDADAPLGSLQDIADATDGTCTEVRKLADLPDVIPAVVAVELEDLRLMEDGDVVAIDSIDVPAHPSTALTRR